MDELDQPAGVSLIYITRSHQFASYDPNYIEQNDGDYLCSYSQS
jgi:hypothetical protein